MNTLCLSHLAEVASNKRPIVQNDRQDERVNTDEPVERPAKKVRFEGMDDTSVEETIPASVALAATEGTSMTPEDLSKLMQKVRRRAERRKRRSLRSPPPPSPAAEDESGSSSSSSQEALVVGPPPAPEPPRESQDELVVMQRKLERMEQAIKTSARMELQLMNQSKKLRDERTMLTHKYEAMAEKLREMQRSRQAETGEPPVLFKIGPLPPLMSSVAPRRIPATTNQVSHNIMFR